MKLSSIFNLRGIDNYQALDKKYYYQTREKEQKISNFSSGGWYDWEQENDYNDLIAKALLLNGAEIILPNKAL